VAGEEIERWIDYGTGLAGALAGAGAGGILTGDPSGAAVFGAVLSGGVATALSEAAHRILADRERARVGAVLGLGQRALLDAYAEGRRLREDAFMRARVDGRAPADEVIEHVIRAAQSSYEERKLPHIAAALATIATAPHVDERTAHWIITEIEKASWPKLIALSLVATNKTSPLPDVEVGADVPSAWAPWSAHQVFSELFYSDQFIGRRARTDDTGKPDFGVRFSDFGFTTAGDLLHQAADLGRIPEADREGLRTTILGAGADADPSEAHPTPVDR